MNGWDEVQEGLGWAPKEWFLCRTWSLLSAFLLSWWTWPPPLRALWNWISPSGTSSYLLPGYPAPEEGIKLCTRPCSLGCSGLFQWIWQQHWADRNSAGNFSAWGSPEGLKPQGRAWQSLLCCPLWQATVAPEKKSVPIKELHCVFPNPNPWPRQEQL